MMLEDVAVEHGADFGAAEGESEVAGGTRVDGVHREAARFVGGAREGFEIQCHKLGGGRGG